MSVRARSVEHVDIELAVNGERVQRRVPVRQLLADFLRDELGLTGTHLGCEHGVCGACTVHVDGAAVRACLMFAVQADGAVVTTVEGISRDGRLNALQQAFREQHGLQCGFCTPGFLMLLMAADPRQYQSDDDLRELLAANLCRCTGYQGIVAAVRQAWGISGEDGAAR